MTHYRQLDGGRYKPRAMFVDSDATTVEAVSMNEQLTQENLIRQYTCAGGNQAKVGYTEGFELVGQVMESVRYRSGVL